MSAPTFDMGQGLTREAIKMLRNAIDVSFHRAVGDDGVVMDNIVLWGDVPDSVGCRREVTARFGRRVDSAFSNCGVRTAFDTLYMNGILRTVFGVMKPGDTLCLAWDRDSHRNQ